MPKIFLVSTLIVISCFISAGGVKALTPNPDAPDKPLITPFHLPSVPVSETIKTHPILPMPTDWMLPIFVSTTVDGYVQSVSTTLTFTSAPATTTNDDIGVMELPNRELINQLLRFPPLVVPRVTSSTVGVIHLSIPELNTSTMVYVSRSTTIRDIANQIIDTTELLPGDHVSVNGIRFRNSLRFVFADAVKRLNDVSSFLQRF